jgi:hypothetical protein
MLSYNIWVCLKFLHSAACSSRFAHLNMKQLQKKLRQNDLTWALYLVAHNAWNFSGAALCLRNVGIALENIIIVCKM